MTFEFTQDMITISNRLWAVTSAVGAGLCFLVLLVIAAVWIYPRSRPHLDRVSFRIVIYALIANMIFGISSAVGGTRTGPSWICGFSVFILQFTLQLSSLLLFCIALNLQLVVVHTINGQKMEKYYLIGALIMSTCIAVPPYATGQYGWDPLERDCWYTNDNKKQRLAWQIGAQMFWTALIVVGEVCASVTVMVFMGRHYLRRERVFAIPTNSKLRPRPGSTSVTSTTQPQALHANTYKKIIIRIALYPLASCIVNLMSIVTALHSTVSDGIHDSTDYNVLLFSDFLYGGRAIVYALLAVSDPALVRGLRVLISDLYYGVGVESSVMHTGDDRISSQGRTVVHIELSTIQDPPPLEELHDIPAAEDTKGSKFGASRTTLDLRTQLTNGTPAREVNFDSRSPDPRSASINIRRVERRRDEEDAFRRQL